MYQLHALFKALGIVEFLYYLGAVCYYLRQEIRNYGMHKPGVRFYLPVLRLDVVGKPYIGFRELLIAFVITTLGIIVTR